MLTELINDKKFKIFLVVFIVGIMLVFSGVPRCMTLSKPATDITKLWETQHLSGLKSGDHVAFDVTLVHDNIGSQITKNQTMGVTTSEKETARYYLLPLITTGSDGYINAEPFLVAKISSQYNSVMTSQINKSDDWWANEDATYDDVPTCGIHFDGRLVKMPAKMRNSLEEMLPPGENFDNYFVPYVFEPIADPGACYAILVVGILCTIAGAVMIALVIKSIKSTPSFTPISGSKYEYYGPQGADQPYQGGYSTTARTANIANKGPSVKDMVGGAFANSGQLPPTTPATPFGNQSVGGSDQILTSLKQREMPHMPEPQPYVSPFTPAGADASQNPLYGGVPVTPAGADAAANPLYGGAVTPATPEEYVSPLANQSGNVNFNPAYGQAPDENYAPQAATEITADALAANSRFLGGMNMDPMLAQTAPIAPPTNPLETAENQNGPAGGLNPALTGQRVQPSPYTQPQATPYAAAQPQAAPYPGAYPGAQPAQPGAYTAPQPAPYTAPQPAPYFTGQNNGQ